MVSFLSASIKCKFPLVLYIYYLKRLQSWTTVFIERAQSRARKNIFLGTYSKDFEGFSYTQVFSFSCPIQIRYLFYTIKIIFRLFPSITILGFHQYVGISDYAFTCFFFIGKCPVIVEKSQTLLTEIVPSKNMKGLLT